MLAPLGLTPGQYVTLIARPEPENSVLEIVAAFSAKRPRGLKLVVLGAYHPEALPYHAQVMAAASPEVVFAGALYDHALVNALRLHGLLYLHGHQVGGTNPSLIEAMGAGNPVLAHDNRFNRWVARDGAWYFQDTNGLRGGIGCPAGRCLRAPPPGSAEPAAGAGGVQLAGGLVAV